MAQIFRQRIAQAEAMARADMLRFQPEVLLFLPFGSDIIILRVFHKEISPTLLPLHLLVNKGLLIQKFRIVLNSYHSSQECKISQKLINILVFCTIKNNMYIYFSFFVIEFSEWIESQF